MSYRTQTPHAALLGSCWRVEGLAAPTRWEPSPSSSESSLRKRSTRGDRRHERRGDQRRVSRVAARRGTSDSGTRRVAALARSRLVERCSSRSFETRCRSAASLRSRCSRSWRARRPPVGFAAARADTRATTRHGSPGGERARRKSAGSRGRGHANGDGTVRSLPRRGPRRRRRFSPRHQLRAHSSHAQARPRVERDARTLPTDLIAGPPAGARLVRRRQHAAQHADQAGAEARHRPAHRYRREHDPAGGGRPHCAAGHLRRARAGRASGARRPARE